MTKATRYWSMAAALLLVVVALPATAQAEDGSGLQPHVVMPVKHGVSQPLRDLPTITIEALKPGEEAREVNPRNAEAPDRIENAEKPSGQVDPATQNFHFDNNFPMPIVNFEGVNNRNGVLPPDTTGDVGLNHYIQWVNLSYQIFDKTGATVAGPFNGNVLWSGFGGSCQTDNYGDPIVLYDHLADRWLMTQFTGNNHQCIAVSQTADPTGAWWLYDYVVDAGLGYFNDYPKLGVWPDGYYYSANMFGDGSAMGGVFERDKMLVGDPAQFIWFFTPDTNSTPSWSNLPADLDGLTLPPADAPNPFLMLIDDDWGYDPPYDVDGILVKEFHVDWAVPGNSTFGVTQVIDLSGPYAFDSQVCGAFRGQCITQPGGPPLEALHQRLMYRPQYRNFGDYETLVVSHTVDADGMGLAGVRWYELRNGGMDWGVEQASTYAPDSDHRWMGDIAMDASGDIAVGFSVSSTTVFPSIRWAGRLAGDTPNTLAQGEDTVIAGGGSQTHSAARWGDYSTMSVDPEDDCTFWYTQEYMAVTGSAPWQTRIAAFKFPSCTQGPSGTVEGTVTNAATMGPIAGATVEVGPYSTSTDGSGFYSITVPADTYDVTASKFGFAPDTATGIVVTDAMTTIQDFALTPNTTAGLDGYVTAGLHGWPLYAMVELESGGMPVGTVYTDPLNGYYEFPDLPISTPYDITVTSMIAGYDPASRGIVLDPAGQTESFILANDGSAPWVQCAAVNGFTEDFDGGTFPPLGWSTVNNGGNCVWESNTSWGRGNYTGGTGAAADADSDACGSGTAMNTDLVSPIVDLSGATTVTLEFKYDYYNLAGASEYARVDISADGGATWTNIVNWTSSNFGPATYSQDVSVWLAGSSAARVRFSYYSPGWFWWFEVDDVALSSDGGAPGFACNPVPGTLVEGFVSDANTAEGINGADVSNNVGGATTTMATPDDPAQPDGYYYLFTPLPLGQGPATRIFTASSSGYAESEVSVNPTPSTAYRLDFALDAGWLEMVPDFLEARLYAGETENQAMSILNYGGLDADVLIATILVPSTFPHLSPITDTTNLPGNTDPTSFGRAPAAGNAQSATPNPNLMLAAVPAFAVDVFPGANLVDWPDVAAPAAWNVIAGGMGQFFAGDFLLGDFSKLYIIDYATNTFLSVDTTTGAQTAIGPAIPVGGESWTGLTASGAGMLYASSTTCASSTLYTIDPGTGTATPIGPVSNAPCVIDIAINAAGELFGVDIVNDNLVQIDPGTGAGTVIGSVGVNANYAQGLDFDEVTGVLYWASYGASGELRVIDTATGASTLVGAFPGGAEVDSFAIASFVGGAGLPWLVLTPDEGLVPGAGMAPGDLPINAEFIADGATHYGLYQAMLSVIHGTPYDVNDTWVCFTKSFNDMTPASFGDARVHSIAGAGITSGCGGGNFCPTNTMTRGVMARWLMLSKFGPDYSPPPCTGIFGDVSCEGTPNSDFIEALYNEGITSGCSASPLLYCPTNPVTRAQMAVFLLKTLEGSDYVPPACTPGFFADVVCPTNPFSGWTQDLYERGITAGCGVSPLRYCPSNSTKRDQMAVFVGKTFGMPMCAWED